MANLHLLVNHSQQIYCIAVRLPMQQPVYIFCLEGQVSSVMAGDAVGLVRAEQEKPWQNVCEEYVTDNFSPWIVLLLQFCPGESEQIGQNISDREDHSYKSEHIENHIIEKVSYFVVSIHLRLWLVRFYQPWALLEWQKEQMFITCTSNTIGCSSKRVNLEQAQTYLENKPMVFILTQE